MQTGARLAGLLLLLLPLFFAYSGLRARVGLVSGGAEWLVAAAKFGANAVAARLTGLRWREASAIGVLMNTRGLMETDGAAATAT